ncbi:transmembrane protein 132D-like [Megalops cyprinoides]|uniref:transmembrane protein 132D-like n=1 Tax=Megalops cyprinoides TaxID=118141 RepID=UPI001864DC78|nr:transmembrane protein 132D-like [Megalops cyprinoides]
MLSLCALEFVVALLCRVTEGRLFPEGLQRFPPPPAYLPVTYQVLNADSAFFLKEANQDLMRNSSLQARTESFFIHQARRVPSVNATYGPLWVEQPVPLELLQGPGAFVAPPSSSSSSSSMFTFNWKVQTFVINERLYLSEPKVQVLFYLAGRDWDDYSTMDGLPCIRMFAFHETQEVRGSCRLRGELGLCVAELQPLPGWFSPPSVIPGRQRAPEQAEGTPVELYYMVQSAESGECSAEDSRKGGGVGSDQSAGGGGAPAGSSGSAHMRRIGSVRLHRSSPDPQLDQYQLDSNFLVLVPAGPIRQRDTVAAFIAASGFSQVDRFTLRVTLKKGVAFLGARPSAPFLWMVSQDERREGHRVITLQCSRSEPAYGQRTEAGFQKILQVDLELDDFLDPASSGVVTWQVEYPGTGAVTMEAETKIRLAPGDLGGIVPLAMDTEIMNTAVLTGRTVAVPVKVVTVGPDSVVTDVTESVMCNSADEDVVKVSDRCDYVYVNGKETRGRVGVAVNFTYGHLSAQLEMTVWMPRFPLQIDVSDTELSQIKGWRVPVTPGNHRSAWYNEDDDGGDDEESGCALQYQGAMVHVLTHFVAEPADPRGQLTFMLGSDWQVEVTELVGDFLRVRDPQVARLQDGQVLMGRETGVTSVQVLSPLSDSVLAESTVKVLDDKVSITELGVQLVSGLSLSLQLSPGSNRAIVATATTQEVLNRPKQESFISAWLQFSDGSMTPLDLYDPAHFLLTATSLDQEVVTVRKDSSWKWPVIVAKGEGQGLLVRVEMSVSDQCQKSDRRSILAAANGNVRIRFGQAGVAKGNRGVDGDRGRRPSARDRGGGDGPYYGSSVSVMEGSVAGRGVTTTTKSGIVSDDDGRAQNVPVDFPAQVDLPRSRNVEDDLVQTPRGLTDLEIGMYALLGVFCLAILVFLINCISYALKYSHKELPTGEGPETMSHAHDWVWLGNRAGLMESRPSLCSEQDESTTMMDLSTGFEEGSHLLNGATSQKNVQGQVHRPADTACLGGDHKNESLNSPTTKRKRVKFSTFTTIPPRNGGSSTISPLTVAHSDDIKWVCQDIELGDSTELRNYMERLNDNASKNTA